MIKVVDTLHSLKEEVSKINKEIDVDQILRIELPFIDGHKNFTVMSIPSYGKELVNHNLMFVSNKKTLSFNSIELKKPEKKFDEIKKEKNGESTIQMFLLMKAILKNYSQEFLKIREIMNKLDNDPILDSIEDTGRQLRKLTDRLEGLFQIILEVKEEEINCFNHQLINFDYELLGTEARYWLERCRSHTYRIASLRTKSEMRSNMELNSTMKKLTVIMTFLSIAGIVVNVPGTVGAIFGIPALSNAYFESHTTMLIITLITTTILSIMLGFLYWKSLGLKSN